MQCDNEAFHFHFGLSCVFFKPFVHYHYRHTTSRFSHFAVSIHFYFYSRFSLIFFIVFLHLYIFSLHIYVLSNLTSATAVYLYVDVVISFVTYYLTCNFLKKTYFKMSLRKIRILFLIILLSITELNFHFLFGLFFFFLLFHYSFCNVIWIQILFIHLFFQLHFQILMIDLVNN